MFSTASIFNELVSGDVSGEGDRVELFGMESFGKPRAPRTLGCRSATVCTHTKLCHTSPNLTGQIFTELIANHT